MALCYISHIIGGGEHPPDFNVLGMTECEACRCGYGRVTKGQEQLL